MILTRHRAATLVLAVLAGACAGQPPGSEDYDRAAARDEIWSKEQAIFSGRSRGDLGVYVGFTAGDYMGWPPGSPDPLGVEQLREGAEQMRGKDQEEIAMEFGDITFSGNTAVIYYSTHKTRLPDGEPVDQTADIAHVWVRETGEWKLLGALGRYTSPGYDREQAKAEIWEKEQAIYAAAPADRVTCSTTWITLQITIWVGRPAGPRPRGSASCGPGSSRCVESTRKS